MKITINISNAAIIALHALDLMAKNKDKVLSTTEMAKKLKASYNHLTKIMQQLTKAGIVSPIRGPKGGFLLTKKAEKSKLKDIIEIMDGEYSDFGLTCPTNVAEIVAVGGSRNGVVFTDPSYQTNNFMDISGTTGLTISGFTWITPQI